MFTVYIVINKLNWKLYAGFTSQSTQWRFSLHCADTQKGSQYLLHKAIRKYGPLGFDVCEIERFQDKDEALSLEKQIISSLNLRKHGYNIAPGGPGGPGNYKRKPRPDLAALNRSRAGMPVGPKARAALLAFSTSKRSKATREKIRRFAEQRLRNDQGSFI